MKMLLNQLQKRFLLLALTGALLVGGAAFTVNHLENKKPDVKAFKVTMDESPLPRANGTYNSFAPIVHKVTPAVVKVVVTSKRENNTFFDWPGFNDPFWRHFFGEQAPNHPSQSPMQRAIGSGVIITKDGYILTNNHVVDGAKEVQVTLQDKREFTAKVVGRDAKTDLAVLKIDANNLPVVPMADSSKVQVGDIVLAIGNPFGVGQTVTQGIVSATGRGNMGIEHYEDFIQTDAAINPGNSGGALVDVEGRLVGINTAILSRSGGNQGIGFAIPSDLARNVMQSLVKYGKVSRGYMGVSIQDVTPALAQEFKLKQPEGVLVGDVVPNSPADKAGIKTGDIVLAFNGKEVSDARHLQLAVADTQPGTHVPVKILRDGSTKDIQLTLQSLPGNEELASNNSENNKGTLNGVTVSDINSQVRQDLKIPADVHGVVVTDVNPDSAAAQAGLQTGDVIEQINRHPVKNAEEAVKMTENAKEKKTLLLVWSKGSSRFLVVDESNVS